ncbi:MAG: zf-HC2 domain-containing protein [Actinomycetota bacterium]|nr:zf-HC2 domain-containing protein [Actinomycetota bacterium]MDQ2957515.1 zf-HC2 domain-containing protein [Actinomycetota bacterium]
MRISRRREATTCRRAVELITDYLEDALPARQRRDLEHHLGQCPHCAEYLVQLRVTIDASGRLDGDQLSPDVRQTLIQLYRQTRP